MTSPCRLALVLSGGNALGAYQAGAYQALHENGYEPDWIVGGSIGAVNGAIICGNPADQRLDRLRSLWEPEESLSAPVRMLEDARRAGAAMATLLAGRPGLFAPRNPLERWWNPFSDDEPASLYESAPLAATLERLVDFDLLNAAAKPPLSVTAVDIVSGEDVAFDTRRHRLTPDHLRASSGLMPLFPPVAIGARLLADPGLSANLPLDLVLGGAGDEPLLCIAIDLMPLEAPAPGGLDATVLRARDLAFATQSRRTIAAWQAIHDARKNSGDAASITLLHIVCEGPAKEKAFDYSGGSAAERWRTGRNDVERAIAELRAGAIPIGGPGLTVYRQTGEARALMRVHGPFMPLPA